MIREHAEDKIAENKELKPAYASWAKEKTGTDRYIAMRLIRGVPLRHARYVRILNNVFKAYGLNFTFNEQAKKAEEYFNDYNVNNDDLNHVTLSQARMLGDKVDSMGLDPLLNALPVSPFDKVNHNTE